MNAIEIDSAVAESEQRSGSPGTMSHFDFVHTSALFLFFRPPGIENHAIPRLQRTFQSHQHARPLLSRNLAQVHPSFLAEAAMHEILIVYATQPAGVEAP